jgi:hypothetical protein
MTAPRIGPIGLPAPIGLPVHGPPPLPSGPVPPQPALPVTVDNCMLPSLMDGHGWAVPVGATFTCAHNYIWRVQWQQAWGGQTQPVWVATAAPQ